MSTPDEGSGGFFNSLINKLPFELHLPGYKFCGPGTLLKERLERGHTPKNSLDASCREHDIAYSQNRESLEARHKADKILEEAAWNRAKDSSASLGERISGVAIAGIMKAKRKIGAGHKTKKLKRARRKTKRGAGHKKVCLRKILDAVKSKNNSNNSLEEAVVAARRAVKKVGGRKKLRVPRILPVPKIGGVIPLVPIFAALSAAGALSGGITNVVRAVKRTNEAQRELEEKKRHNWAMEQIALGKGLYLKPFRKGLGIHFDKQKN